MSNKKKFSIGPFLSPYLSHSSPNISKAPNLLLTYSKSKKTKQNKTKTNLYHTVRSGTVTSQTNQPKKERATRKNWA